jgi:hypothetical protein
MNQPNDNPRPSEAWHEVSFESHERAQRQRESKLSFAQKLESLESLQNLALRLAAARPHRGRSKGRRRSR